MISVPKKDLEYLGSFGCEHVIQSGDAEQHCDKKDGVRGACCNSCWARRWAKQKLHAE